MRALMLSLSLVVVAACSGRQVEVRTGPEPTADVALHVTNNLSQPVNVYVVSGVNDIFLKQVAANTVEHIPVTGVAAGSTVNLRAVTVDGSRTYTKNNVTLSTMYDWRLP
ncbi:MAG TPA: hypothetical protein VJS39_10135 [Gemmatimonadaceae bacterium]|jgi:hypothetical protein|nr:MAG: hypothetical protein AUG20_00355 [Gemmatimonas sp. 13_1_20CM_3_60_15]HKR09537.1 hypothetical protein [Gemmatimonadaceae bacterium]